MTTAGGDIIWGVKDQLVHSVVLTCVLLRYELPVIVI